MADAKSTLIEDLLTDEDDAARLEARNESSFVEAERNGLMLAAQVRTLSVIIVVIWIAIDNPISGWSYAYQLAEVSTFALVGVLQYYAAKHLTHVSALKYGFVALDCAWLAVVFSTQNPFDAQEVPASIVMNGSQFGYFYLFLMQAAFSFRPSLVLWSGACIIAARVGMLLWVTSQPGVYTDLSLTERTMEALFVARTDNNFVFLGFWAQEILVTLILATGLAAVVRRSRKLINGRIRMERARANLARYFSPNVVDRLGAADAEFGAAREQHVAILFVDILGFTAMCEQDTPQDVIAFLRSYHDRLGRAVFENNGTLDKYLGDGLMATFGTPDAHASDPAHALQCAYDMLSALQSWNAERTANGQQVVRIGIGIHYGAVIAGDIGNQRRLEYSVIGDAVNVASRLEQQTRVLNAPLVVSDAVVDAIRKGDASHRTLLDRLTPAGAQVVRGRSEKVDVWVLSDSATTAG